jgi:hypothetical protein
VGKHRIRCLADIVLRAIFMKHGFNFGGPAKKEELHV